jgi:hypothetical protein
MPPKLAHAIYTPTIDDAAFDVLSRHLGLFGAIDFQQNRRITPEMKQVADLEQVARGYLPREVTISRIWPAAQNAPTIYEFPIDEYPGYEHAEPHEIVLLEELRPIT